MHITCAWCGDLATTEIEVEPQGKTTIPTSQGKRAVLKPSRRFPACETHANPAHRHSTPRARGPIEGQLNIYDAHGTV